uniref:Ribosomal RNA small subunit methyltransferase D n=1 Tax=Vitiosangium cumulatum TaxID=1867796 RepID=A0A7D4XM52_9BACT|nr:ribosomal RNA small subunit methyltransferase D [Vitiosangium cumulatum]
MRIVAGSARGRALAGPKATSKHIRPTADRVRETIFNVLGQWLEGQKVLDLYAGTGALGLESISRGASRAVLVDSDREALSLCRTNTDALGFGARVEVLAQPVERALETLGRRGDRFELIFADPPYAARVVETVLEGLVRHGVLAPGGTVVIEHDKREAAPESHEGFERVDQRRFGDTLVSLFRIP